jgi:beta-phosphoglucomutase-like phosphatase (HAD superfamily)
MARGVIFDVDGTLVDSVDLHAQAWQDAFRMFGHDIDIQTSAARLGRVETS